jgi:hypothetical protein
MLDLHELHGDPAIGMRPDPVPSDAPGPVAAAVVCHDDLPAQPLLVQELGEHVECPGQSLLLVIGRYDQGDVVIQLRTSSESCALGGRV